MSDCSITEAAAMTLVHLLDLHRKDIAGPMPDEGLVVMIEVRRNAPRKGSLIARQTTVFAAKEGEDA